MHLFRQQAVRDPDAAAAAIPAIDFGANFFAAVPGALARLAAEFAHACGTHSPNPERVIACPPCCSGPCCPPAVYRGLVLEFCRANHFHQNGHRSAAAKAGAV